MKNNKYRLAQKDVILAILIVKLAQEILILLSMAFNYPHPHFFRYAFP
jgi:hypothetical protein